MSQEKNQNIFTISGKLRKILGKNFYQWAKTLETNQIRVRRIENCQRLDREILFKLFKVAERDLGWSLEKFWREL